MNEGCNNPGRFSGISDRAADGSFWPQAEKARSTINRRPPRKVERMNDEELGLPRPEKYEGEQFSVEDYKTEEYAEARTLEEAIAIRGAKAFLRDVTPDDFLDAPLGVQKIGIADL